jgi:epoxyqueuosine reductase
MGRAKDPLSIARSWPTPPPLHELTPWVLARCADLGFAAAGVCKPVRSERADALIAFANSPKAGPLTYLAQQADDRADPCRVMPSCKAIVMVMDRYAARTSQSSQAEAVPIGHGKIARYARGRDYHTVIKARLHVLCDVLRLHYPSTSFRAFTDSAPIQEREHAAAAGLGWIAKNGMLINPRLGSYTFLAGFLTDLPLTPTDALSTDHCGSCTKCIDACPTQAIARLADHHPRVGVVDASRCISALNIELPKDQRVPPDVASQFSSWLFGCDICQEVCPHNSPLGLGKPGAAPHTDSSAPVVQINPNYEPINGRISLPLADVAKLTDQDRSLLGHSAIKRAATQVLARTASILLANAQEVRNPPGTSR